MNNLSHNKGGMQLKHAALPELKKLLYIGAGILSLTSCKVKPEISETTTRETEKHSCCSASKSKSCSLSQMDSKLPVGRFKNIEASDIDIKINKSANAPKVNDMALIPAKTVVLGSEKIAAYEVEVKPFLISKTETTNAQFAKFVEETGYITTAEKPWNGNPPASMVFSAPKELSAEMTGTEWWKLVEGANWKQPEGPGSNLRGKENLPVVHVTLEDAMAYAKWAGIAIPTEAQYRAAAATDPSIVPDKILQPDPKEVNFYQGEFPLQDKGIDGHAGLAPVASYKANSHGVFDLAGNGWELTSTYFDDSQQFAVIAGGSFLCSWEGRFTCTNASAFGRARQDLISSSNHVTFRTVHNTTQSD